MKFDRTDAQSLLSQIKHQEKQIKLKRRWLLGVPPKRSEKKKLKKYLKNSYLSESLLREDDMFYESVRTHVEGPPKSLCTAQEKPEEENPEPLNEMDYSQMRNMKKLALSCLDYLTTKGLYLLAMIVTRGSYNAEITCCKLKKVIKDSLSSVLGSKCNDRLEISGHIFSLLTDPQNFRDRVEPLPVLKWQSYHTAVAKVLRGLEGLSSQTLIAMRRKLKEVEASVPQLQPRKHGWARDHLIKLVNKICTKMLIDLGRGSELPEPLAKAMAVADLSLKLTSGRNKIFAKEFYEFSPEVKSLQSDIMNAICYVKNGATIAELKSLQLTIEPTATISIRCIRTAFVNFLTEFLFECSDMDSVPKSLLQILDVVKRGSNRSMHGVVVEKKYIEEEVDCILNTSALTKQIVLDLLPDSDFDEDFNDAYLEQMEESDDSGSDEDDDDSQLQEDIQYRNETFGSIVPFREAESMGDFVPFEFHHSATVTVENGSSSPLTTSDRLNTGSLQLQSDNYGTVNSVSEVQNTPPNKWKGESSEHFGTSMADKNNICSVSPNLFCKETESMATNYSSCKNQYLATQDVCDKTSMLAYKLIGHMMKEFAKIEGQALNSSNINDTKDMSSSRKRAKGLVQVVEELIPSFPESSMDKLKMLMDL